MFRPDLLKGKRILVTGGGTGLGKSIGRRYLELGADLVICGRRIDVVENSAAELHEETGGNVSFFCCDICDVDAIERMMDEIWEAKPLDILVNNAAGNFIARTETLSYHAFDAIVNIVLHGTAYCTMACGRRWIKAGRKGTVLSIVATTAFTGKAYTTPSAAAKAGIVAMTKSLAVEWGPKGIRLVCIAPGLFPTEGAWEKLYPPGTLLESLEKSVPLRRLGRHIELTNLCSYLVSEEAGYITGESVVIDGGCWMQNVGGPNQRAMQDWTDVQWNSLRKR